MDKFKNDPRNLLILMAFIMPFSFSVWQVLLNNYVVDVASFSGKEIGALQSIREIPGFLAFASIYLLLVFNEQKCALVFLALMCLGVGGTGYVSSTMNLYFVTFIMSVGFHYFETFNKSLTLQWVEIKEAPAFMGKVLSITALGSIISYSMVWLLMEKFSLSYKQLYLLAGITGTLMVLVLAILFPVFPVKSDQHKKLILRKKYSLFYILTFLSGARRQIFMVFAGFMMVEKFHYSVADISALYLINCVFNFFLGPKIGALIGRIGEKKALLIEYSGLILIFTGYAFASNKWFAASLYVLDHLFFAMAIALKTYFQKIANPADIAATTGVSFTINHISAVVIPVILGVIWMNSPSTVFLIGAGIAATSLILSRFIKI